MKDVALSKEGAIPAHIFGMLYDNWTPNMDENKVTVFIRGYEKRGNNERKRIYFSAVTPELCSAMYSDKIKNFLDYLFDDQNEGKPLMRGKTTTCLARKAYVNIHFNGQVHQFITQADNITHILASRYSLRLPPVWRNCRYFILTSACPQNIVEKYGQPDY